MSNTYVLRNDQTHSGYYSTVDKALAVLTEHGLLVRSKEVRRHVKEFGIAHVVGNFFIEKLDVQ